MNGTYDNSGTQIVDARDIWTRSQLCQRSFCFGLALFVLLLVVIILGLLADAFLGIHILRELELTLLGIAVISMASTIWGMSRSRIQLGTFARRVIATMAAAAGVTCVPTLVFILDLVQEFARLHKSWPPLQFVASTLLFPTGVFLLWLLFVSIAWPFAEDNSPIRIKQGTNCPQCGYCVRGVSSRICPECGRAFSLHDLGLSEAAFEQLTAGELTFTAALNEK